VNVVFLSPHFPPNFYQFCVGLRQAGATVIGVGDEHFDNLRSELRSSFREYYRINDMNNYDELLRALGFLTFKHGKLERLDSLNEHWLETEAKLRTDFNITGIKTDGIGFIKQKSEMKKLFLQAGVPVARGRVCLTPEETRAFAKEVGFPIVGKPDIGVGAAKTYKITDSYELEHYLNDKLPVPYILEEFVSGEIVTFDGLTDLDGKVLFSASHRYSRGVMETVNEDSDIFYYSLREIPAKLEQAGLAALKSFNVRERFFHLEFFDVSPKKDCSEIVALEANIRPPGGLTVDMFNYANDIDVYKLWADLLVNGRFDATCERPYFVLYSGRKNHLNYALSNAQVLNQFSNLICHQERIMDIFAPAIGNHGYLLRHPELEPLLAAALEIQKKAA
jgi:hypothetical protein